MFTVAYALQDVGKAADAAYAQAQTLVQGVERRRTEVVAKWPAGASELDSVAQVAVQCQELHRQTLQEMQGGGASKVKQLETHVQELSVRLT